MIDRNHVYGSYRVVGDRNYEVTINRVSVWIWNIVNKVVKDIHEKWQYKELEFDIVLTSSMFFRIRWNDVIVAVFDMHQVDLVEFHYGRWIIQFLDYYYDTYDKLEIEKAHQRAIELLEHGRKEELKFKPLEDI